MMATPWGPSAVPTGGAGVAAPALIWILTTAATFFFAMSLSACLAYGAMWCASGRKRPTSVPGPRGPAQAGGSTRAWLELGDLGELQLDGGLPAEQVEEHLDLELVLVDLDDLAVELGEGPFLDPHGLAHLVLEARLGALGRLLALGLDLEER